MKNLIGISALLFWGASASHASLIALGPVPSSGSGLGAVNTLLTFTSPGGSSTETGCVGAGSGGSVITGSAACPSGFTGGNEQAANNVFSTASAGFTNFNNLQLIFNASEPGSAPGISLDSLALTIFSSTGVLLQTHTLTSPYSIADAFPGTGNAGFGFMLDSGEAAQANALLTGGAVLYIGASANASEATGGLETIFIRTTAPTSSTVPEPVSLSLVGGGLLALGLLRKRLPQ